MQAIRKYSSNEPRREAPAPSVACAGETQAQAQGGRQHHHPHERCVRAELRGPADICLEPRRQGRTDRVCQSDATEGHGHDQHQIGEAGNALMLGLEARDALLQFIDGRGIGATACIDLRRTTGEEDQRRHPHIADTHVDHGELAEGGRVDVEHFAHRQHVGATTDPAAGQRSHAGPGVTGHGFRMHGAHQQEGHDRPEHDAGRCPRYISTSFGPSRRMPLMSTARVSRISAAGSRMSRAIGL